MSLKRLVSEQFRSIAAVLSIVLTVCGSAELASAVVYTNVTASAGINYLQNPGNASGAFFQTGGAAAADYDNDGWVDLYVTRLNGARRPLSQPGKWYVSGRRLGCWFHRRYCSRSDGTNGPAWGDIDNDGDQDLYVTACGGKPVLPVRQRRSGPLHRTSVQRGAAVERRISLWAERHLWRLRQRRIPRHPHQ